MAGPDSAMNKWVAQQMNSIKAAANFIDSYTKLMCFRIAVNNKYAENKDYLEKGLAGVIDTIGDKFVSWRSKIEGGFKTDGWYEESARQVFRDEPYWTNIALEECLRKQWTEKHHDEVASDTTPTDDKIPEGPDVGPFDRRLYRTIVGVNNESQQVIPMSTKYREAATSGLMISEKDWIESGSDKQWETVQKIRDERLRLQQNTMHIGVPALQNTYALTKLYGSDGGARLVNRRNERKWYEVDQAIGPNGDLLGFSSNPTTSSLIAWGAGDPYGRTPYHFTDFVFSKYWNKVENNRLITLRRFGAPIVDNLKFPGMDGMVNIGNAADADSEKNGAVDQGSTSKIVFPPMASAITYFGDETGNDLSSILKFTTGLKWDEAQSNVWEVNAQSTPDSESGPGGPFKTLATLSKMLAVGGGNFNQQLIANKGALPPDPYGDGMPYENRIMGPVNRIDAVKKRAAGLEFQWDGLNLVFEYVARPVGGVNPKAVLLDILSNFLIIGSASAVFFGGQHRFMADPAKYPFLGGEKGIEAWYSGKPLQWANNTVDAFVGQVSEPGGIMSGAQDFFNQLIGKTGEGGIKGIFGAVKGLFSEGGIGMNIVKHGMASKSAGTVPYLTGLKALLTGEPVGEWHVTVGNPLNPIAMIGNLICTGIEVEFGNELGPDDFPTEIKITVKMDHGMARDRDAIQSVFNRGMGRIYDLPDGFEGSADGVTGVDAYTQNVDKTGQPLAIRGWLAGPSKTGGRTGNPVIKEPRNEGSVSVWDAMSFRATSPNQDLKEKELALARSQYRDVNWVALKSLK